MTLEPELFNAVLAMDSYNRGYNAAINILPSGAYGSVKIGLATIYDDRADIAAENIGFYAIAYNYNGGTIIAFRGTDYPEIDPYRDVEYGWTLGAGFLSSEQGKMAVEFYQAIAGTGNYFTSNNL